MDVTVYDKVTFGTKVKSIDITSVVIQTPQYIHKGHYYFEGKVNPDLHIFFCWNCQNPLFQYAGKVISITRGSTPYTPPLILQCFKCKQYIHIVDID